MTSIHDQQIQAAGHREYIAPQLITYGSVNDLTAGGSSGQAECEGGGKGKNAVCRP